MTSVMVIAPILVSLLVLFILPARYSNLSIQLFNSFMSALGFSAGSSPSCTWALFRTLDLSLSMLFTKSALSCNASASFISYLRFKYKNHLQCIIYCFRDKNKAKSNYLSVIIKLFLYFPIGTTMGAFEVGSVITSLSSP